MLCGEECGGLRFLIFILIWRQEAWNDGGSRLDEAVWFTVGTALTF
jgi:hypothetical protein